MSLPLLLFLILLGFSKVVLLVNPLTYHALNHELFALRCFLGVAVYFVIDVLLYLVLGNVHYCHPDTLTGMVRFFELDLKIKLEDFAHVSIYHILIDALCVLVLLVLELIALVLAWKADHRIAAAAGAGTRKTDRRIGAAGAPEIPIITITDMSRAPKPEASRRPVGITSKIDHQSANGRGMQANDVTPVQHEFLRTQNSNKQHHSDVQLSIESVNQVLLGADESIVQEQIGTVRLAAREIRKNEKPSEITHQLPQTPVPGLANPSILLFVRSLENQCLQHPVDQFQQPGSDQ